MATFARLKGLKALSSVRARDPLRADTHRHMALVAFLAWVGLGADGLSSACYGPEEAFRARAATPIWPPTWRSPWR